MPWHIHMPMVTTTHHHLSSGGSPDHAAAPAPAPLGHEPANGRDAGGRASAAWAMRDMYDLMALCHEKKCRLAPDGDNERYIVTMGTSATAERGDQGGDNDDEGEGGVSTGATHVCTK